MKTATVPAQITTVEDKIAGNLTLAQMILLALPVFLDFSLYAVLPPSLKLNTYKLSIMAFLSVACGVLAIRVRGKLLLLWMITIARYNLRPRLFLYNKNSLATREEYTDATSLIEEVTEDAVYVKTAKLVELSTPDKVRIEALLDNPAANVSYNLTKRGLRVTLTEVKD